MRALVIAAAVAVSVLPQAASADPCHVVHGRMSLANGTPSVRIWVVGTRRMLGVIQQDETFDDLPASVRRLWGARGDDAMWASYLFGDFRVCPLTPSTPGKMQLVRLTAARNLKVRPRP